MAGFAPDTGVQLAVAMLEQGCAGMTGQLLPSVVCVRT